MQRSSGAPDTIDRVREIVADALGVETSAIAPNTEAENIEAWDSVAHLAMMLAIEAEFGVRFEPEDLAATASVDALARVAARGPS